MRSSIVGALSVVALAASGTVGGASLARADDAVAMRRLVAEEVKTQLTAKKEADAKDNVFKARWNNGLLLETADKRYTLRIGGRIHLDTQFVDARDLLEGPSPGLGAEFQDQSFFRRLQLYVSGDLTEFVDYRIQLEFAEPDTPLVRDAYITIKNLKPCLGCWAPEIRAGQQFEPVGLESTSSTNFNAFIERSLTSALHPERSLGLCLLDSFWNEHATGRLGLFSTDLSDVDDGFGIWDSEEGDGGYAVTGRFTLVPWAKDKCRFVHLGVGGSWRQTDEVRLRARPGLFKGPFVVDTGALTPLAEDTVSLWNAEVAFVWNSFHAAAEYTLVNFDDTARDDPSFSAWYVQAGWFLTGEAKAYDFKRGLWANNKPCCNFLSGSRLSGKDGGKGCCCWGALELVARYDTLDLNDGTVAGGEMTNIAAGLNWYLNPNARIMFDVVFSNVKDRSSGGVVIGDDDITSFLMRWDVHF